MRANKLTGKMSRCVTSSPTMVIFQPALNTMSAACGSFQTLASATGDTLPGSSTVPPITMTSCTNCGNCGSSSSAAARLPKGPTATSVISSGWARAMSTMNCAEGRGSSTKLCGARCGKLPKPSSPWMCAGGASPGLTQGRPAPRVTGSARPASALRYSALVAACSTVTLPKVVVMPTISMPGCARA